MTRVSLVCLFLFSAILAQPVPAQELAPDIGRVAIDEFSGTSSIGSTGAYFLFRKDIGSGVGYQDGFSNLGIWVPVYDDDFNLFWVNGRLLITDDADIGGNVGVGWRMFNPELDRVFGASIWYDTDESYTGHRYNQMTVSLETLGRVFDVRGNFYLPDEEQHFVGVKSIGNPRFTGNGVLFDGTAIFEQSMRGGDVEIGAPLPLLPWLRAYGGAYFYDSPTEPDPVGVRGRLEASFNNAMSLEFAGTHDDAFGTTLTMAVDLRLNGRKPTQAFQFLSPQQRMYLPTERQYRIATRQYREEFDVVGVNPATGNPLRIVYVDNSNAGPGTGTFEDPFQAMPANASGADIIYVRTGNSSAVNPVLGGITLANNQRLLGEGLAHVFDVRAQLFDFGFTSSMLLPGATTGPNPFLSNPGGFAVQLASNNEVAGLNIINSSGGGIIGANINNVWLHDLSVQASGLGVSLSNIRGSAILENLTIANNLTGGLLLNSGSAPLSVRATDIISSGNQYGLQVVADSANATVQVESLSAINNGVGLELSASGGNRLDAEVTDTTLSNNTIAGMRISGTSGTLNVGVENVVLDDNTGDGLQINLAASSTANVSVVDSSISDNGADNIDVTLAGGSLLNLLVDPTPATGAGDNGFRFDVAGASTLNALFQLSDLSNAGSNGILGTITGGSTVNLQLEDTPVNGAGQHGMLVDVAGNSVFNATVTNGSFANNGVLTAGNGIYVALDNNSAATLNLFDTPLTGNGGSGLRFDSLNGSDFTANIARGSLSDNLQNALRGEVDGIASTAVVNVMNVAANNSGFDGMNFIVGGGSLEVNVADSSVNNSGNHGVRVHTFGGGSVEMVFSNTDVTNSQANGLYVTGLSQGTFAGLFTDGSFDSSGTNVLNAGFRNGIVFDLNNADATLTLRNTGAASNGENGMLFNVANGGSFAVRANDTSFSNNLLSAVDGTVTGPNSSASVIFTNVTANNSGADGFTYDVLDGGSLLSYLTNVSVNRSALDGVNLAVDGGASVAEMYFVNSSLNANGGDGYDFTVTDGGELQSFSQTSTFMGNGTAGSNYGVRGFVNGADAIAVANFDNSNLSNNTRYGIGLFSGGAGLASVSIHDSTIQNNRNSGIFVDADGGDVNLVVYGDTTVSNNGTTVGNDNIDINVSNGGVLNASLDGNFDVSGSNSVDISATNGGFLNNIALSGSYRFNPGAGINISLDNSVLINLDINEATIVDNRAGGIAITGANSAVFSELLIRENLIDQNTGGDGILVSLDESVLASIEILDHVDVLDTDGTVLIERGIERNSGNGIHFNLANNSVLANATVDNNSIVGNGGAGVRMTTDLGVSILNVSNNSIRNNTQGGVITSLNEAVAIVDVTANTIASNNSFGFGLTATDSVFVAGIGGDTAEEGNTFDFNRGAGVMFTLEDDTVGTFEIVNNTITNTRTQIGSTTFQGEGINVQLDGSGTIATAMATLVDARIDRNLIGDDDLTDQSNNNGNNSHGILFSMNQFTMIDGLTIGNVDGFDNNNGNSIVDNGGDGIRFRRVDTSIIDDVVIADNLIDDNDLNGIDIIGREAGATSDVLDFQINDNTISNNTIGIALESQLDTQLEVNIDRNLIDDNSSDGIRVSEFTLLPTDSPLVTGNWSRNTISNNGGNGVNLLGRHIINLGAPGGGNTIVDNALDGITVDASGSLGILENSILRNGQHGIDVNAVNSDNLVVINDNIISGNGGDGIELLAHADVDPLTTPFGNVLTASLSGNTINNNEFRGIDVLNRGDAVSLVLISGGSVSGNDQQGIYVINTASTTQTQDGASTSLNSDGNALAVPRLQLLVDDVTINSNGDDVTFNNGEPTGTGLVIRVGTSDDEAFDNGRLYASQGAGGVVAVVRDSEMRFNGGSDVYIDSFVSAVTRPGTTINRDPLARLDLWFMDNEGEQLEVSNVGAYYDNADAIKSPVPPFETTSRSRNAQRLPGDWIGYSTGMVQDNGLITVVSGTVGTQIDETVSVNNQIQAPISGTAFNSTAPGAANDFYNQYEIELLSNGQRYTVSDYANTGSRFTVTPAIAPVPVAGDLFDLIRSDPTQFFATPGTNPVWDNAAGFYDGLMLRFTNGPNSGQSRVITSYGGAGDNYRIQTATFGRIGGLAGNAFVIEGPASTTRFSSGPALTGRDFSTVNNDYNDPLDRLRAEFTTGVNAGEERIITGYQAATTSFLFTDPFTNIPNVGDFFRLNAYDIVGIGDSTFRVNQSNNTFTSPLSDNFFGIGNIIDLPPNGNDENPLPSTGPSPDPRFRWDTTLGGPAPF